MVDPVFPHNSLILRSVNKVFQDKAGVILYLSCCFQISGTDPNQQCEFVYQYSLCVALTSKPTGSNHLFLRLTSFLKQIHSVVFTRMD